MGFPGPLGRPMGPGNGESENLTAFEVTAGGDTAVRLDLVGAMRRTMRLISFMLSLFANCSDENLHHAGCSHVRLPPLSSLPKLQMFIVSSASPPPALATAHSLSHKGKCRAAEMEKRSPPASA